MVVGVCQVDLFLPGNGSLKEKRRVLRGLKDRIRERFNVSVAEVDGQDKWQRTVLGLACVGTDRPFVNEVLDKILGLIRGTPEVEIIDSRLELL
jgi:uncharacterized protein YlxP (DUF503 family)